MLSSLILFAQAAADNATSAGLPPGTTFEPVQMEGAFTTGQWVLFTIYSLISVGLIIAVISQTHKSEALAASMMGGGSQAPAPYKGKKSTEDNLNTIANTLATAFIFGSMIVAFAFR